LSSVLHAIRREHAIDVAERAGYKGKTSLNTN